MLRKTIIGLVVFTLYALLVLFLANELGKAIDKEFKFQDAIVNSYRKGG